MNIISSTFNGNLTVTSPGFLLKNSTFNGESSFTRNGTSNHQSDGGNVYNGNVSFSNNGSGGRLRLATTTADTYNANATFNSTGQDVQVAYLGENLFKGDITINSNKVVFNTSTGKVTFAGSNNQTLNGSYNYPFKKLAINKQSGTVTANSTLSVDDTLFFVSGKLITTSTNLLTMKAGSVASGASNLSFVSGPIKKTGNTAFQFPVGKNSLFRKIEITAPSNATDAFTAEYFDTSQTSGSTMDTTISFISDCGYWSLTRNTGSSNITPKFAFDSTYCDYLSVKPVHIAFWNGTKWVDKGEGVNDSNTKKTNASVTSYGNFALAYKLMPGDAPQMPYVLNSNSTCSPVEMLFENSDLWFSFEVDSALIKLGIFAPDPNKWYAPLKELVLYEKYTPGSDLTYVHDWQMDCDSALFSFQTFSTDLDTSKKYLAKFSKYEIGDCDGISDTTSYYLNICLRNLRMFTGSQTFYYSDENDLLAHLGVPGNAGPLSPGDVLIPGAANLSINLSSVAPLVIDGVLLSGDYDLINNPQGTLLFTENTALINVSLQDEGYMFVMKPGAKIQNIRLQGPMPGLQDYNQDLQLCAALKLEKTTHVRNDFKIKYC
ncbi:MAG TPA: hypothetical protein PKD91_14725, partial [Bacteroidia bacterium]|nr:hypothetical protein [Bacteroidia bacterium]